jgi:hypothetical protein
VRLSEGRDEISPALKKLVANASDAQKKAILGVLANRLSNANKRSIAAEKQYDGAPMKSPAKERKFEDRFAKSYNWRYRPGYMMSPARTNQRIQSRQTLKGERRMVRRRVPVTETSKQLQDTGATIKSIDILSVDAHRARVGPKTGHGELILSVHEKTRRPFGISDGFAHEAREYAFEELMKGV